jgi:tripartite-type tricarboxylate transporter receptor subunit TctC
MRCDSLRHWGLSVGDLVIRGVLGVTMLASTCVFADNWPARPIKILVPAAAGTTSDLVSRVIGTELAKRLGQSVVVENKPGAGGTIATAELARAAPDGYTIAFATLSTLVIDQALFSAPGYDSLRDFVPVAFVGGVSNVMIVRPSNPANGPQDIVAAAKARPGELTFSSGGNGSSHHISGVLFAQLTGAQIVHVPYQAATQALLAVISGEVTMGFLNTPSVVDQIRSGQVKALGVTSLTRSPLLPNVPTLDEQGIHGYEVTTWFGFIAPAKTPPEIVARLNTEINGILSLPDLKESWVSQGFQVAPPTSPSAFTKLIREETSKWIPIVKASGATPN